MWLHFLSQCGFSCWLCFAAFAYREDRAAPFLSPLEVSAQAQVTWLWSIESQAKGKLLVIFILLGDCLNLCTSVIILLGDWLTLCTSVLTGLMALPWGLSFLSELPYSTYLFNFPWALSGQSRPCPLGLQCWVGESVTQITRGRVEFWHAKGHREEAWGLCGYWTHSRSQTMWDGDGETQQSCVCLLERGWDGLQKTGPLSRDGSSQQSALFHQWHPLSYPSSWSTVSSGPWGSCWIGKRTSPWPSASSWPWGQPEACTGTSVGRGRPEEEDESASVSAWPRDKQRRGWKPPWANHHI